MPLICEIRYLKSKLNLNLHCSVRVGLSVDSNDDAGGQAAAAGTLRDITQRFNFFLFTTVKSYYLVVFLH